MSRGVYIGEAQLAVSCGKIFCGDADGKARTVVKGYIGDANGLAAQFFPAMAWNKYAVEREPYTYYAPGTFGSWSVTSWGASGYSDYSFSRDTGAFSGIGELYAISESTEGYSYYPTGDGYHTLYRFQVVNGALQQSYRTAVALTGYRYTAGEGLGTVYTLVGRYPDADLGYTYVQTASVTINGTARSCVIMQDGSDYYAYY